MDKWQQHPDQEVQQAIIRLCDALCSYERATGLSNLLVLIQHDYRSDATGRCMEFVADSGKPLSDDSRVGMTLGQLIEGHQRMYANA